MDENFILEIKAKLAAEKHRILGLAEKSRKQDMVLETDDLPDEVDQASSEYNKTIAFRLRGREQKLLSKIDDALERIKEGEYGLCEECEEPIGERRLLARPVTTLCISCKEEQEQSEKRYG